MSRLEDATERAQPILDYVRKLENQVRRYKAIETGWNVRSFGLGLVIGVVIGGAASLLFR